MGITDGYYLSEITVRARQIQSPVINNYSFKATVPVDSFVLSQMFS